MEAELKDGKSERQESSWEPIKVVQVRDEVAWTEVGKAEVGEKGCHRSNGLVWLILCRKR